MSQLSRVLVRPLSSAGSILCFHSVISPELPAAATIHTPLPLLVAIVEGARRIAEIVPLPDLWDRHATGRSTAGLIAITFDDAYAALSMVAGQFFTDAQVPVTVFAVSDAVHAGSSFWWDRVEDISVRVPETSWRAFELACGVPAELRSGQPAGLGRFHSLRQFILSEYAGRWPQRLAARLSELEDEIGYRTLHRSMNRDELRAFTAQPWVHLGVHTRSHPVLPLLSDDQMAEDIASGHDALREQFDRVVPILAVPYGLFDARTLAVAARVGMQACLTLEGHPIRTERDHGLSRLCIDREAPAWRQLMHTFGRLDGLRSFMRPPNPPFPTEPSANR